MTGVFRRWADAIVIAKGRLTLIEAAIRPDLGDPCKLEAYKRLIPHTPELEPYRDLPVDMVLVYAIEDPLIVAMAREKGIKCHHFRPETIEAYIASLYPREGRAPLTWPVTTEEAQQET